jgi:hypothetical protein
MVAHMPTRISLEFQFGEGLRAQGGRGLVCPKGHGLYVISEWNT